MMSKCMKCADRCYTRAIVCVVLKIGQKKKIKHDVTLVSACNIKDKDKYMVKQTQSTSLMQYDNG